MTTEEDRLDRIVGENERLRRELEEAQARVTVSRADNAALRRVVDLIMWEVAHFTKLGRVVQMTPEVWNSLAALLEPKPQEPNTSIRMEVEDALIDGQ